MLCFIQHDIDDLPAREGKLWWQNLWENLTNITRRSCGFNRTQYVQPKVYLRYYFALLWGEAEVIEHVGILFGICCSLFATLALLARNDR